jgi:hypothetical protein
MKTKHFMMGFVLGILVLFVVGAAHQRLQLFGELSLKTGPGIYQSTFSGVSDSNMGYLAITNTRTGRTEIFGMTEYIRKELKDIKSGRQGSVVLDITME